MRQRRRPVNAWIIAPNTPRRVILISPAAIRSGTGGSFPARVRYMSADRTIEIPLARLTVDPGLQVRVDGLDGAHVAVLIEAIDKLPPPKVLRHGDGYLLE